MYQIATALLQPFVLILLIMGWAVFRLWRGGQEKRSRAWLLTAAFILLIVLCLPAASFVALGTLEWFYPPTANRPKDVQAVVVLSGYVYPSTESQIHPELGVDSLYRCIKAAELYHQGPPCLILVSGGKVDPSAPGPNCSEAMADLLRQLGVPRDKLIVETNSRTTYENAVESRAILEGKGIHRVALVTDAAHLFRAVGCFRKQGIDVAPCGCRYHTGRFQCSLGDFVPTPHAAAGCLDAWHEWLGSAWYWMNGRL